MQNREAERWKVTNVARNVEIKASLSAAERLQLQSRAAEITSQPAEVLLQVDTFYHVKQGRLKLREFVDSNGDLTQSPELIQYFRPDQTQAKTCNYRRIVVDDPELPKAMADSLGIAGVVKKRREVFIIGQTRIHLDEVNDLGSFLELEVVLQEDQTTEFGEQEMAKIMRQLGIESPNLISVAYVDLLLAR